MARLLLIFFLSGSVFAADELDKRTAALAEELRCLVCQNQNLADSDAGLAQDLRNEVLEMMRAGKSDAQIRDFLVARYGEFVLYRPPVQPTTWLLWFGPAVVLLAGLVVIVRIVRKRSRALPGEARGEEDLP